MSDRGEKIIKEILDQRQEILDQREEIMNEVFDTTLYVGAAVWVSMVYNKTLREPLGILESLREISKIVVAMSLGKFAVKCVPL